MIKLTKNELKTQQLKLTQLERYLPTLRLKKALLQSEVNAATAEIESLENEYEDTRLKLAPSQGLLTHAHGEIVLRSIQVDEVKIRYENIAGVEIPHFEGVTYQPVTYSLFETPFFLDAMIGKMQELMNRRQQINVVKEKRKRLAKELREVSIRVNLFEKILIPRTKTNIKKIKVFLGDQQLAAVSQAKVAKRKILQRKALHDH